MSHISSVCVFCGSRNGNTVGFAAEAEILGRLLAQNTLKTVYGGGQIGLMGILAKSALAHGGHVTGIIPKFLNRREIKFDAVSEIIETETLRERIRVMAERSDAFIVLPGGVGTLDELMQMLTMNILREHDKALILIDKDGFWQPLIKLLDAMSEAGFLYPGTRDRLTLVGDAEAAVAALQELNAED
ncbi:MAG: TIGR00730 family Rossman fold protein [Parvibaculales bacterium]